MMLTELHAAFWDEGKSLAFVCPTCPNTSKELLEAECIIAIPVSEEHDPGTSWGISSRDIATLSVTPSIWHHCKSNPHFFIHDGRIDMA